MEELFKLFTFKIVITKQSTNIKYTRKQLQQVSFPNLNIVKQHFKAKMSKNKTRIKILQK